MKKINQIRLEGNQNLVIQDVSGQSRIYTETKLVSVVRTKFLFVSVANKNFAVQNQIYLSISTSV